MKKVMGVISASAVLAPWSSQVSFAETRTWVDDKNGNDVKYVFDDRTKTLTISGKGNIGYSWRENFKNYFDNIIKIIIKKGIKKIGQLAFMSCEKLKDIAISNTVETIGVSAFGFCYSLNAVYIPCSVGEISEYAFHDCIALRRVIFERFADESGVLLCKYPEACSNVRIGDYAFANCKSLLQFVCTGRNVQLCENVFDGCIVMRGISKKYEEEKVYKGIDVESCVPKIVDIFNKDIKTLIKQLRYVKRYENDYSKNGENNKKVDRSFSCP